MKLHNRIWLMLLVLAGTAGAAQAQEKTLPPSPLVVAATNLMAGDERHKEIAKKGGDPSTVLPGDVVRFRLTFTNLRPDAVRQVVFDNPVPQGMRYVAGSAGADRDGVRVEYSIDGGANYSAQPMVEEKIDGKVVKKPAPVERYTHVRWKVDGSIAPAAQVVAEFRVQLREAARASSGAR